MLGLAEQVGRAHFPVDAVVGNHQRLSWAGEQIDADAADNCRLASATIRVAGADHHVQGFDALGTEGHRADRLHAAQQ